MAYTPLSFPTRLTAEDMGYPSYGKAIREGFQTAADVFKPRTASEALLAQQLQNKMRKPYAENADEWFQADLGYKQALANQANRVGQNYLTPYQKMQLELQGALDKDRVIAEQKEARGIESDLPTIEKSLKNARRLKEIAETHPELFGPGAGGFNTFWSGGPSARARTQSANIPEFGEWETLINPFVAETAKGLSSKPLALSLNTAIASKPSFSDQQKQAIGKIEAMIQSLERGRSQASNRYKSLTNKEWAGSTYNAPSTRNSENNKSPKYKKPPPGYTLVINPKTNKVHKVKDEDVPKYVTAGGYVYEE